MPSILSRLLIVVAGVLALAACAQAPISPPTPAPALTTPTLAPAQAATVAKVVYHADFADPRRFSAMLTSINNMVTTYQHDLVEYDVRIVLSCDSTSSTMSRSRSRFCSTRSSLRVASSLRAL